MNEKEIYDSLDLAILNIMDDADFESVVLSMELAEKNYDGIVHIKSFGCTPELNAMTILEKVSNDYDIPIIYFSFDSEDNEVAIDTRLEAFYDMMEQKKKMNQ